MIIQLNALYQSGALISDHATTPFLVTLSSAFSVRMDAGITWVRCGPELIPVKETPEQVAAMVAAAERAAKFEERVHQRAEALYCLWIREMVDDPSHYAAYEEAIRFVTEGQAMIDKFAAEAKAGKGEE